MPRTLTSAKVGGGGAKSSGVWTVWGADQATTKKSRKESLLMILPTKLGQEGALPGHHGEVSAEKRYIVSHKQQGQGQGTHGATGIGTRDSW